MASLASFDRKKGADRPGITGVDEAGRGSLCGPVIAAAVLLDAGFYGEPTWLRKLSGANDSKKLTAEKRAEFREIIAKMEAEGKLKTAWAAGSVMEISAHNILGATRLAMARSIAKLAVGHIAPLFAAAGTVFFGIFAKPSDFSSVLLYASILFLPAAIMAMWLPTEEATS